MPNTPVPGNLEADDHAISSNLFLEVSLQDWQDERRHCEAVLIKRQTESQTFGSWPQSTTCSVCTRQCNLATNSTHVDPRVAPVRQVRQRHVRVTLGPRWSTGKSAAPHLSLRQNAEMGCMKKTCESNLEREKKHTVIHNITVQVHNTTMMFFWCFL